MNQIVSENVQSKIVLINGKLFEVYTDGRIYRFNKKNEPIIIQNTNNSYGYNKIGCNGKIVRRHRILAFAFLGLDIDDRTQQVDHIDHNRINNCLTNLRVVNNQQNSWNRSQVKGYCWNKLHQKYQANICVNGQFIYLGYFETEDEARAAYLSAKLVYHQIN